MNNKTADLSNSEDENSIKDPVLPIMIVVVFLLGNGNALVLLKCTSKRHGWKPFYRFVGALIVTDFLGLISTVPVVLVQKVSSCSAAATLTVYYFFSFCTTFGILSSALIICLMSFDRCLAITRPFVYRTLSKNRRTTNILASIWLSSACVCALPLAGFGSTRLYYHECWYFINFIKTGRNDRLYIFIYSVICCCILVSTFILNCVVIIALCRNSHAAKIERNRTKKHDIFAIILLTIYFTAFGACLTPLAVTLLINAILGRQNTGLKEQICVLLAMTNGILDPWIYILFRKEHILTCMRCCRSGMKRFYKQRPTEINTVARSNPSWNTRPPNSCITTTAETHMNDKGVSN